MQLETFAEVKAVAREKWREYREAEKKSDNPLYGDLKKMYSHIKNGKVLCDITEVIKAGGVHESFHPKLAVARASAKVVNCRYDKDGSIRYRTDQRPERWKIDHFPSDVDCKLQAIPKSNLFTGRYWNNDKNQPIFASNFNLKAPVPLIPPKCMPKSLTDDHYILWEVDTWEMVPPTDPYLLRRITKNIFAIEAQWDLTPLEKAAMAGRLH